MELRDNIKNSINSYAFRLLKDTNYTNTTPFIIAIFLSNNTKEYVNASLKEAFASSFSIPINNCQLCLENINDLESAILDAIRDLSKEGKNYDDIYINFISFMHESFYIEHINMIDKAIKSINNYGLSLNNISMYGIFDQRYIKEDYSNAFIFINKGKYIWNNIFHIELSIISQDIDKCASLIALHSLSHNYDMKQDGNDYHFQSLSLNYLRIPEILITSLLYEIYNKQLDISNLDKNLWESNTSKIINNYFDNLFSRDYQECYNYLPLNLHVNDNEPKKGLFSLFKKEKITTYHDILLDKDEIKDLCNDIYSDIVLDYNDYLELIKNIIYSVNALSNDYNFISKLLIEILEKEVDSYVYDLKNISIINYDNIINIDKYLKDNFNNECKRVILSKKIDIINHLIEMINKESVLNDYIKDIINRNNEYISILKELTNNEYGGYNSGLELNNIPVFSISKSIDEILDDIDINIINDLINNENMIYDKLKMFLSITLNKGVDNKHTLGEINGIYNNIEPVKYLLLISNYNELINQYTYLNTNCSSIYKSNSIYIISYRDYSSDKYIVRYKRG